MTRMEFGRIIFSGISCAATLFITLLPAQVAVAEDINIDSPAATDSDAALQATSFLHGEVERRHKIDKTLDGNLEGNDTDTKSLQSEVPSEDRESRKKAAIEKLEGGKRLTARDYRNLGIGVFGFDYDQQFFHRIGIVKHVYSNGPAFKAGLRPGDKIHSQKALTNEMAKEDPTQQQFGVTFAEEGTQTDFTIVRHGQPEVVTLTRMNVEDIEDPDARHMWEELIQRLGYKQGTYIGTSMRKLEPDTDTTR